ncbi:MAG: FAD-binding oxidoreductase, partial [Planctomycetota bacterium]
MEASVNTLLQLGGAGACATVGAIAVRDGLTWWRRRQRLHARRLEDRRAFRDQVALTARRARMRAGRQLAWQGTRPLRVVAVVDECRGVRSFYLADPDGRPLPDFLPGQHLTVHLPTPSNSSPTVRCYSLSDRPREESYRLTIKRCPPPSDAAGAPPGVGSNWIHDRVRVGDELTVGAPSGDFYLDPSSNAPLVLVGGGIGVTPILSMALALAHRGLERDVNLIVGVRSRDEFPLRDAVEQLREASPRLRVFVVCSRPEASLIDGHDYQHRGHVTVDYLRAALPSSNYQFYVCGPPRMMQTLVPGLLEWGVPDDAIHFEAFGPASVPRQSEEDLAAEAVGLLVRFARRDAEAVWPEQCQTLLE